jgi:anti-sigma factor RsiW
MNEWHPLDSQLAGLGDPDVCGEVSAHVRACPRCRRVVAAYDWLEVELAETLKDTVQEVVLPQSPWWKLRTSWIEARRRRAVSIRTSALVSAVLVLCLLLCGPGFLRPAVGGGLVQPSVHVRPTPEAPAKATGAGDPTQPSQASALLPSSRMVFQTSSAPALVPLPTPPDEGP